METEFLFLNDLGDYCVLEVSDEAVATYLDILAFRTKIAALEEAIEQSDDNERRREWRESRKETKTLLTALQHQFKRLYLGRPIPMPKYVPQ